MGVDIKLEQYNEGLVKHHSKCTNHKSTSILLTVPKYSDLLNNQGDEDEDECGCLLVDTAEGWQTEMVKWIAALRAADAAEGIEDAVEVVVVATTQLPQGKDCKHQPFLHAVNGRWKPLKSSLVGRPNVHLGWSLQRSKQRQH